MPFVPDNKPTPGFVADNAHSEGESHNAMPNMESIAQNRLGWSTKGKFSDSLPAVGGALGAISPIPGGATLGAAAGSAAKQALSDQPASLAEGAKDTVLNGVIPNALGAVGSKVAGAVGEAAQNAKLFQWAKQLLADEPNINPKLAQELKDAQTQFTAKQIAPRMQVQNQILDDKAVPLNLKQFEGIHPDIDAKISDLRQGAANQPYGAGGYGAPQTPDKVLVPGKDALQLRAMANKYSNFTGSGPYDQIAAEARNKQALGAGNEVRQSFRDNLSIPDSDAIDATSSDLRKYMSLNDDLMKGSGRNPGQVFAGSNISKGGKLAEYDQAAGTNLRAQGQALDDAQIAMNGARSTKFIGDQNPTAVGLAKLIGAKAKNAVSAPMSRIPDGLASMLASPTTQQNLQVAPSALNLLLRSKDDQQ